MRFYWSTLTSSTGMRGQQRCSKFASIINRPFAILIKLHVERAHTRDQSKSGQAISKAMSKTATCERTVPPASSVMTTFVRSPSCVTVMPYTVHATAQQHNMRHAMPSVRSIPTLSSALLSSGHPQCVTHGLHEQAHRCARAFA